MNDRVVLHGIGVSSGTASGRAVRITPAAGVDTHESASTDVEADGQRVREAFNQVSEGLLARAEKAPEASKAILSATAGLAIFLLVMSLNILGDSLRDALDPRAARR